MNITTKAKMLMISRMHRWFEQLVGLTTFFYHSILTATQAFQDSCFVLSARGKLKRFLLVYFNKEYVRRQLSTRQGTCRQCGACCKLLFTCPMLTKQDRCLVYGTCRPHACRVFPIDQRDIEEVKLCGVQCGYHFNTACSENTFEKRG